MSENDIKDNEMSSEDFNTLETTPNHITGYNLAQLVNQLLKMDGIDPIPPQMIYRYIKDGRIPSEVVGGRKMVPLHGAREWVVGYLQMKKSKAQKSQMTLEQFLG